MSFDPLSWLRAWEIPKNPYLDEPVPGGGIFDLPLPDTQGPFVNLDWANRLSDISGSRLPSLTLNDLSLKRPEPRPIERQTFRTITQTAPPPPTYNQPQPRSLADTTRAGAWDFVVQGGQGRTETGGTHGGHPAVDIFAPEGTPIYAPADGVSSPGLYPLGGNATTIRGDDGRYYYMAHGQRPFVGGRIRRGQIIGYVGRTGNARNTPAHLHYAVASNATYFDRWNGSGDLDPAEQR